MKYTLKMSDEDRSVTLEFEAEGLDTLLTQYEHFLKACGFYFDGTVDIVEDK